MKTTYTDAIKPGLPVRTINLHMERYKGALSGLTPSLLRRVPIFGASLLDRISFGIDMVRAPSSFLESAISRLNEKSFVLPVPGPDYKGLPPSSFGDLKALIEACLALPISVPEFPLENGAPGYRIVEEVERGVYASLEHIVGKDGRRDGVMLVFHLNFLRASESDYLIIGVPLIDQ